MFMDVNVQPKSVQRSIKWIDPTQDVKTRSAGAKSVADKIKLPEQKPTGIFISNLA